LRIYGEPSHGNGAPRQGMREPCTEAAHAGQFMGKTTGERAGKPRDAPTQPTLGAQKTRNRDQDESWREQAEDRAADTATTVAVSALGVCAATAPRLRRPGSAHAEPENARE